MVGADHAGGDMKLVATVPAAEPTLFDRDRFGIQSVGDAEPLRIPVGARGGGLRQIADDDVSLLGRQPPVPSSSMS